MKSEEKLSMEFLQVQDFQTDDHRWINDPQLSNKIMNSKKQYKILVNIKGIFNNKVWNKVSGETYSASIQVNYPFYSICK